MMIANFFCCLVRSLGLLALLCALGSPAAAAPQRHLFLDPAFVNDGKGVTLRVNPAQQREIVIRPDQPWEQLMISLFLTVRDEEGKVRMWYICRDKANQPNVAYAESRDGVNFTKPNLGIVEHNGTKANNLVGLSSLEGVVFQDPKAPPAERYAYVTHLWEEGMVRFHSPDGLHWNRDKEPLMRLGADTQNVTFWDERIGKYVMYVRAWQFGADKKKYRKVARTEVSSLTQALPIGPTAKSVRMWGPDKVAVFGDEFPIVLATDERDPANTDVYNISAQPYPLDPRWYVGFPSFFQRERGTSDGRLEVNFVGSTNGIAWHRYDRTPYARPGLAGSESQNMVFMGTGMAVRGDEIWQYGTGLHFRHGDKESRKTRTDGVIYRYVQRVDGFVSLDFNNDGGTCTTAPVPVTGPRLLLNVDTAALGNLRVGLLDATGQPLDGFSAAQCQVLRTNGTRVAVGWTNKTDLAALRDRQVRVSFAGSHTKLYSFFFDSPAAAAK